MTRISAKESTTLVGSSTTPDPGRDRSTWSIFEALALLIAAALLTFPNRWSPIALVLLPLVWLVRLIGQRHAIATTGSDWPLVGLLLMTSVSLYPSVDLALSLPKLDGIILDFFAFSVVVTYGRLKAVRQFVAAGLCVAALGVAAISLVGTSWSGAKLPFLRSLYTVFPHLIGDVPTSGGILREGFNPNEVGGTLALLFPFVLALILFPAAWWTRIPLIALAALLLLTLLLSASRSAAIGVAVGVVLLLLLRWPRLTFGLPLVLLAAAVAVVGIGPANVAAAFVDIPIVSTVGDSIGGRQEVWSRALAEIRDFPLTGIGLNTFPVITDLLYPFFQGTPHARVPHAHNLFLQTALDLGVLGLVSFLGVLLAAAVALARAWQVGPGLERTMVAALASGIIAHLVFGLTDAVALGAKPGILLWVMLGGAIGLGRTDRRDLAAGGARAIPIVHLIQWALFALACALAILVTLLPSNQVL